MQEERYVEFGGTKYPFKIDKHKNRIWKDRADTGVNFALNEQRQSHTLIKNCPSGLMYQFNRGHPTKVAEDEDIAFFRKNKRRFMECKNSKPLNGQNNPDLEESLKNKLVKSGFSDNTGSVVANEYGSEEAFITSMLSGDNFLGVLHEDNSTHEKEVIKLLEWCKKQNEKTR
jgi:hypothetical protein